MTPPDLALLPRVAYIGHTPLEDAMGGAKLLYRLFQEYPPERLLAVENNISFVSEPERRLPGVVYKTWRFGRERLLRTRFASFYNALLLLSMEGRWRELRRLLGGFEPEAIVTVWQGHTMVPAARLAERLQVPLHLICHDCWFYFARHPRKMRPRLESQLGRVYRGAASRLCVSPAMERLLGERYGAAGETLYPSRAKDAPRFEAPPERLRRNFAQGGFVAAYAGSVSSTGQARGLAEIAEALEPLGGRVALFSNWGAAEMRRLDACRPNMEFRGVVPADELILRLRDEADLSLVLACPEERSRAFAEMSFPSKLTDCTAAALPLLIWGPPRAAVVDWARRQDAPLAMVVESGDRDALRAALEGFVRDPSRRDALARGAAQEGDRLFSYETVRDQFWNRLAQEQARRSSSQPS